MKKLIFIVALMSLTNIANACPKGTHPTGGTGTHHKGGTCV